MKKVLLFVLGMLLIFSLIGSGAGAITADGDQTQTATVSLTISSSYTVTIPITFTIDAATKVTQGAISCQVYTIPGHQNVTVNVTSDNFGADSGYEKAWALKYAGSGGEDYAAYLIGSYDTTGEHIPDTTESPVQDNGVVLDVPAGTEGIVYKYLHFKLIGSPDYSGSYTDTLTFTVSLTENRNPSTQEIVEEEAAEGQ